MLLATGKIAAVPTKRWKLALSALFGALYALLALFPSLGFLLSPPMRLVSGVFMVLISFSHAKYFLRLCLIFFAVSAGFGGLIFALSLSQNTGGLTDNFIIPFHFPVLIAAFLLSYVLFSLIFTRLGRHTTGKTMDVTISLDEKSVSLVGFVDTGHSLTCPLTQCPIFVTTALHLAPLFPPNITPLLTEKQLQNPIDLLPLLQKEGFSKCTLVPYTAIGQSLGFLLCFPPDTLLLNSKKVPDVRIALSPTPISDGDSHHILIHGGFQ